MEFSRQREGKSPGLEAGKGARPGIVAGVGTTPSLDRLGGTHKRAPTEPDPCLRSWFESVGFAISWETFGELVNTDLLTPQM